MEKLEQVLGIMQEIRKKQEKVSISLVRNSNSTDIWVYEVK